MTREEWIEKAFELLNGMEADLWLLGEFSEDAYTKAKEKFIDHITTQCPEDVRVDIEGAEFFKSSNPVWLGAVIYNDNEQGEEK